MEWNELRKRNRGSGKSMRQLSQEYRASTRSRSKSPVEEKHSSSGIFEDLPEELNYLILSGISARDLTNFCRTRKEYKRFCDSDYMWQLLYQRDYPYLSIKASTFRGKYRKAFEIPIFDNWSARSRTKTISPDMETKYYLMMVDFPANKKLRDLYEAHEKIMSKGPSQQRKAYTRVYESDLNKLARRSIPSGDKWRHVTYVNDKIIAESYPIVKIDSVGERIIVTDDMEFVFELGVAWVNYKRELPQSTVEFFESLY